MAINLTPVDIYPIVNLLVKEATGQNASISVVDTSTFAQAGEFIAQNATLENTLHALTNIIGKTMFSDRKYTAHLASIQSDRNAFASLARRIKFYARENEAEGAWNTDLYDSNLKDGVDNTGNGTEKQTGARASSMWKQNAPIPVEIWTGGHKVLLKSTTIYEEQFKVALRDENEFARFTSAIMTEVGNDLASDMEAENRGTLLNYIGGLYDIGVASMKLDLTTAFNTEFGTTYTRQELLTTYATEFYAFFVATIKNLSDMMTYRSTKYHAYPVKTIGGVAHHLMEFTPKSKQKLLLYNPMFTNARTRVFPEIFNPSYLDIGNYEGVMFWQNINEPTKVKVTPNVLDTATGASKKGAQVALDYVVGVLYDEDALAINYQMERVTETPLEAKKLYRNVFWHYRKSYINDFSSNGILLYMS